MRVFPNSRAGETESEREKERDRLGQTDRQTESAPRWSSPRMCADESGVEWLWGRGFSLLLDSHASYYYYKTKSNLFERGRRSRVNKLAVKTE